MKVIDSNLLKELVSEAKASPRLRMNYNFHKDLNDKCQRLLIALEPSTSIPIHHHKVDEVWLILKGKIKVKIYNDQADIIEESIITPEDEHYGVQIPAGTWHTLECLESGTVIFECKEGPYVPHEIGGILETKK